MLAVLMSGVLGEILSHARFSFLSKGEAKMGIDALDRADGDAHIVYAPEPELGAQRAVGQLAARLADEFDHPRSYPASAAPLRSAAV